MISNSMKLEILQMFAWAESEADPEGKAMKFLEAIDLTTSFVGEEVSPGELVWIANVRCSNCRMLVKALQQLRNTSLTAWMAYCKVISNFSQELREEISKNKDVRRAVDHFFAMHCPLNVAPRVTKVMLGEISLG
jgi:hypothetical protein